MNPGNPPPSMNQQIFNMGLDTTAISVYLMCCGLTDALTPLTMENIRATWVGTKAELSSGLDALRSHGIVRIIESGDASAEAVALCSVREWNPPVGQ